MHFSHLFLTLQYSYTPTIGRSLVARIRKKTHCCVQETGSTEHAHPNTNLILLHTPVYIHIVGIIFIVGIKRSNTLS